MGIAISEAQGRVGRAVGERMELLEGLPGPFIDSRPNLGETGDYQRLLDKLEELRPEI